MPWTAKDAYSHTKKASSPTLQHQWATIANSHLEKTGDEAAAIRIANDAINKTRSKSKPAKPPVKETAKDKKADVGKTLPPTERPGMASSQPLPAGLPMEMPDKA